MKKTIPRFTNEDEEREFWATADSTKYLDWSRAEMKKLVRLKAPLTLKSKRSEKVR